MTTAQRHVRRLRVAADSDGAARALLPRLDDALRCASLPDAGARLLLVRRLVLGRVAPGLSSQALSRLIEARWAEDAALRWVDGAEADAVDAEHVVFASALQARIALVARRVNGLPCDAWYWPRAVPAWRAGADAAATVALLLREEAAGPLARVALPALCAGVVARCGVAALVRAATALLGDACCRAAGWMPEAVAEITATEGSVAPRQATVGATAVPGWLACLLAASAAPDHAAAQSTSAPAARGDPTVNAEGSITRAQPTASPEPAAVPQPRVRSTVESRAALSTAARSPSDASDAPSPRRGDVTAGDAPVDVPIAPWHDHTPTRYGGLPFLLPVLQRLQLPAWANDAGLDAAACARAVFARALASLRADVADPAWQLANVHGAHALPQADTIAAPASWAHAALAPSRSPRSLQLPQLLDAAMPADTLAALWLVAVRRWLRRGPQLGLATLVCRRAVVAITPTHVDLHFSVNDADLRLRRHGLDIDPGWLPWFGRVVTYHYGAARAPAP